MGWAEDLADNQPGPDAVARRYAARPDIAEHTGRGADHAERCRRHADHRRTAANQPAERADLHGGEPHYANHDRITHREPRGDRYGSVWAAYAHAAAAATGAVRVYRSGGTGLRRGARQ